MFTTHFILFGMDASCTLSFNVVVKLYHGSYSAVLLHSSLDVLCHDLFNSLSILIICMVADLARYLSTKIPPDKDKVVGCSSNAHFSV